MTNRDCDLPAYTRSDLCQLDDLHLSCIGCCGRILKDKSAVEKDLKLNTKEHAKYHSTDMKKFIWRFPPRDLRSCGICPNLINDDVRKGRIHCPGHPERNNGRDHRQDYCDSLHMCKTAFLFSVWDDDTKERFLKFLKHKTKKQKMDWYHYSIGMDSDSLLTEFEDSDFWNR